MFRKIEKNSGLGKGDWRGNGFVCMISFDTFYTQTAADIGCNINSSFPWNSFKKIKKLFLLDALW